MKLGRVLSCVIVLTVMSAAHGDVVIVTESVEHQPMGPEKTTVRIEKHHGDWIRSESKGEKTATLTNTKNGDIYFIGPDGKASKSTYGARKSGAEEGAKHLKSVGGADGKLEWKSTGRREKVGEWDTEIFTFEGPISKGTAWVASSLVSLKEQTQSGTRDSKLHAKQFFPDKGSLPGLIVREEAEINMGAVMQKSLPPEAQAHVDYSAMKVRFANRVLSVEEKDLPESEFAVPTQ